MAQEKIADSQIGNFNEIPKIKDPILGIKWEL